MSILSVVQDATDILPLVRPSVVITSTDLTLRQLLGLAIQEAKDLNRMWWRRMTREHTFTTEAAAAQSTAFPSDFDRWWPNSFWNRTTDRPVVGPVSVQDWQQIQAQAASGRIVLGYRERDASFLLTPTPPAGETIGGEYISTDWARTADLATAKARWTIDTDTSYFDEWLLTLGIIWRWRKSKGLPYDEDHDSYTSYRDTLYANDGGSTTLSIAPEVGDGVYDPVAPESITY